MTLANQVVEAATELAGRMGTPFIAVRKPAAVGGSELYLLVVGPHEGIVRLVAEDLAAAIKVAHPESVEEAYVCTEGSYDGRVVNCALDERTTGMFEVTSQGHTTDSRTRNGQSEVHIKALAENVGPYNTQLILRAYATRLNMHD